MIRQWLVRWIIRFLYVSKCIKKHYSVTDSDLSFSFFLFRFSRHGGCASHLSTMDFLLQVWNDRKIVVTTCLAQIVNNHAYTHHLVVKVSSYGTLTNHENAVPECTTKVGAVVVRFCVIFDVLQDEFHRQSYQQQQQQLISSQIIYHRSSRSDSSLHTLGARCQNGKRHGTA